METISISVSIFQLKMSVFHPNPPRLPPFILSTMTVNEMAGLVHFREPDTVVPNGHLSSHKNKPQVTAKALPHDEYAPSYSIRETLMGSKRPLKVIFMGMGASGINFAAQLQKRMENIDLVVYEKNSDLGGTWLENRYPGQGVVDGGDR